MSDQEQREIAGNALIEYAETRRKLAALNAKAGDYAKAMTALANALHRPHDQPHFYSFKTLGKEWDAAMDKYPTKEALTEIAREIESTSARKRELYNTMKAMGYEPKESD